MNRLASLELKISVFLRIGVIFSGLTMFAGWMAHLDLSENIFFNFQTYDKIPTIDLLKYHLHRKDWGVLLSYIGLISLICLPITRVLLTSVVLFGKKDFFLGMSALIVFLTIIGSIILGINT